MGTAHQCSGQSSSRTSLAIVCMALLSASCETTVADSIWPPADFEVSVEELRTEGAEVQVVRRFRVHADGVVFYGTSTHSLVDPDSKTRLPVFERVAIYQLEPQCTRALARRIEHCGVVELDGVQGERGGVAEGDASVAVTWCALGQRRVLTARGRVHGAMADILAILGAHFPDGERLGLPGVADRGMASVLRGVPVPQQDAAGALAAQHDLLQRVPNDRTLVLDTFALACHLGRREVAAALLVQWAAMTADERHEQDLFPEDDFRLTPTILARLLPSGSGD